MGDTTGTLSAHPALLALSAVDRDVAELAEANLWSMSETELLDLRIEVERTLARLQSTVLVITREVDARGAAVATGAASTESWLRGRLLQHPGAAKREVRLARDLDADLPATRAALAAGEISVEQAEAVADGVRRLPRTVEVATRREAEQYLAAQAREFDPAAVHRLTAHLVQVLDPERGAVLEMEEARQADRQELNLVHGADGGWRLRGSFGPVDGGFLDTALQAVSGPRPRADGSLDPRQAAQRRAEGLVDLVKAALAGDDSESGGEPVALTVTTDPVYLRQDAGTAGQPGRATTLEDGTVLSPETTRRLACDAWLVAAVASTTGEVLDIGRTSRVVPRPMRRALVLRDRGCAFPGCGRPPRWCHAHHIWHWARGGPTKLSNLALLCGYHHRLIHHGGWDVDIGPDGRASLRRCGSTLTRCRDHAGDHPMRSASPSARHDGATGRHRRRGPRHPHGHRLPVRAFRTSACAPVRALCSPGCARWCRPAARRGLGGSPRQREHDWHGDHFAYP